MIIGGSLFLQFFEGLSSRCNIAIWGRALICVGQLETACAAAWQTVDRPVESGAQEGLWPSYRASAQARLREARVQFVSGKYSEAGVLPVGASVHPLCLRWTEDEQALFILCSSSVHPLCLR